MGRTKDELLMEELLAGRILTTVDNMPAFNYTQPDFPKTVLTMHSDTTLNQKRGKKRTSAKRKAPTVPSPVFKKDPGFAELRAKNRRPILSQTGKGFLLGVLVGFAAILLTRRAASQPFLG